MTLTQNIFFICSGAFCTIEGCIDRRNNEYLTVKIIDIPKMTLTTGLTIEGNQFYSSALLRDHLKVTIYRHKILYR